MPQLKSILVVGARCRLLAHPGRAAQHLRVRSQGYSSRASCELARQLMTHHDIRARNLLYRTMSHPLAHVLY